MNNGRIKIFVITVFICYSILYLQILRLQLFHKNRYDTRIKLIQREIDSKKNKVVKNLRGDIYDRNGKLLARSVVGYSCKVYPQYIRTSPETVARILSKELGLTYDDIFLKLNERKRSFWAKRKLSSDEVKKIKYLKKLEPQSITLEEENVRVYPLYPLFWHILGTVNEDHCGISGIELSLDKVLSGRLDRGTIPLIWQHPNTRNENTLPMDVYLTVDSYIQNIVEETLNYGMEMFNPKQGIVVVQNVNDGTILAFACRPIYDEADWKKEPKLLNNPGISEPFEPGSIFKPIILAIGLKEKAILLEEKIFCDNGIWYPYEGKNVVIHDHLPLGFVTVYDIVKFSSNIGFAKISQKIAPKILYQNIIFFGFGNYTGIELPAESKGLLNAFNLLTPVEFLYIGFGHGIGVTAIQLISAYSAIANGGTLMAPCIINQIKDKYGKIVYENKPRKVRDVIPREVANKVKEALECVVTTGTGRKAAVKGYRVAGKTGTAQKYIPGTKKYAKGKYVSSFCGFFPFTSPNISILVVLDEPKSRDYYGGEIAAPLFSMIATRIAEYLCIPPDSIEVVNAKPTTENSKQ